MSSLQGKRVIVIGGTSGIGLAAARAFADASADVVVASRSAAKLDEAAKALGGAARTRELDFRSETEIESFFAAAGAFDHLVVTAGEGVTGPFGELPVERARSAFDSKFWGQYLAARAAIPYIREGGSIAFTSGVYGVRPAKGAAPLAAINSAIEGLARGLAVELAPIRVNVVSPGIVDTPVYGGMPEPQREALFAGIAQQLPAGRVGQPADIGQCYVYLAANGFTTGTVLFVDGGARLV